MAGEQLPSSHFTLHLDKALSSPVEKAAWNPEKDLLAMVTKDQQLIVHRFNWQRLWAVSPEKKVTSICWRPDGKALAVGHEDGSISIHDVENGDILRQTLAHQSAVECLTWIEEGNLAVGDADDLFIYEDRTPRFFPPPPKMPAMPGTASGFDMSGVLGPADDHENAESKSTMRSFQQRINMLCSGDRDGLICLSVFGVFPIGKLNLRDLNISYSASDNKENDRHVYRLLDASALKVLLFNDLRQMVVLCSGRLTAESPQGVMRAESIPPALYCMHITTSLLGDRRKELHQVALQASSIEELLGILHASIVVMQKQWADAIVTFSEKIQILSGLLQDNGSQTSPRDEFLSLLSCGSVSAAVHQFLAGSLGEGGLKRLAKTIDTAVRELHTIISEHLQPASEILAFRVGELRGLSRWSARLSCIGLDKGLMDKAMEDAGMVLVQVERLLRIVSDTAGQFRLFFVWLTKSLRQLNNEPPQQTDQLPVINSAAVASFLKTHFEKDLIGPHLAPVCEGIRLDLDLEESRRLEELAVIGGFSDTTFLQRTLTQQVDQLHRSCQEAFHMPSKVVSPQLSCEDMLLLCRLQLPLTHESIPLSLSFYEDKQITSFEDSLPRGKASALLSYICFEMHSQPSSNNQSIVGILRGWRSHSKGLEGATEVRKREVIALRIPDGYHCVDLALYKEKQLVLLLGRRDPVERDTNGQAWLMLLQTEDLPFVATTRTSTINELDLMHFCFSMGAVVDVQLRDGKARLLSQSEALCPLAVSASRGLACVFAGQRRALLYDLEEDEDGGDEDME